MTAAVFRLPSQKHFAKLEKGRYPFTPPPFEKGGRKLYVSGRAVGGALKSLSVTVLATRRHSQRHFAEHKNFAGLFERPRIPKAAPLAASRKRRNTLSIHNAGRGRRTPSGGRWRRGKPTYGVSPLRFHPFDFGSLQPAPRAPLLPSPVTLYFL